jgi:hypothetical protein
MTVQPDKYHFVRPQAWTPDRDQILIDRYPTEGATKIAAEMGRTPESIKSRAYVLGLKVRNPHRGHPKPSKEAAQAHYGLVYSRGPKVLEPVAPEVERAAIEAFLAAREVTQCPTMYAAGGECIQHIGNKAGVNRGARKL